MIQQYELTQVFIDKDMGDGICSACAVALALNAGLGCEGQAMALQHGIGGDGTWIAYGAAYVPADRLGIPSNTGDMDYGMVRLAVGVDLMRALKAHDFSMGKLGLDKRLMPGMIIIDTDLLVLDYRPYPE